jgi:hypothetical protein
MKQMSFCSSFILHPSSFVLGDPTMRRALRRAVGVLLATGVVGLARPALAQPSSYLVRNQQPQAGAVQYEENTAISEGHSRLEEMKVQLALLADVATFP